MVDKSKEPQNLCDSVRRDAFVVKNADHTDYPMTFTLAIHHKHVIIVDMELEMTSVIEGKVLKNMLVPAAFPHMATLVELLYGFANRSDNR